MRTTRLQTVPVLVATTRCHWQGKGILKWTSDLPHDASDATYPTPPQQTDACENITLPQTSFAGGNNGHRLENVTCKHTFDR